MFVFSRVCVSGALLLGAGLLLGACSDSGPGSSVKTGTANPAPTAAAATPAPAPAPDNAARPASVPGAVEAVIAKGTGFAVGANMMAAKVLYVLFDPQCPHCGHLWETSKPLVGQIRIVWMPVAFMGPKSAPQGAAILAAADPAATMNAHEARLSEGQGGMEPPANPDPALLAKIQTNTALWRELKGESVPFLVFKDAVSGQSSTLEGALETSQLRQLLRL
jgi:thiol:disulfide interchange protein DsbG